MKDLRERIYGMLNEGISDKEIMRRAKLTYSQLLGYKSAHTRRENEEAVEADRMFAYAKDEKGIYLPLHLIERNLSSRQKSELVNLLDRAFSKKEESTSNSTHRKLDNKEQAREVIIGLLKSGADYETVHNDPRLRRVSSTIIAAYLAHFARGSYKNSKK